MMFSSISAKNISAKKYFSKKYFCKKIFIKNISQIYDFQPQVGKFASAGAVIQVPKTNKRGGAAVI